MGISKELMVVLICPKCKGDVKERGMFIVCENCESAYPILDGDIPDMLMDDAWKLEKAKESKFKHNLSL